MSQFELRAEYDKTYLESMGHAASRSAEVIVPIVMELVRPGSVIDVGCGLGNWLACFKERGVCDVLGLDGAHVEAEKLEIPRDQFLACDFRRPLSAPRRFDLALCLEVAEHLPEERATSFIEDLTHLAPVILFSAAIPFQGGRRHINEQWPEYWIERFARMDYAVVDCLRDQLWNDARVEYWYSQNVLVFAARERLPALPALEAAWKAKGPAGAARVHPALFVSTAQRNLEHHGKAEFYASEAERLRQANDVERAKVESYAAEVAQLKAEFQAERAKVLVFAAEETRLLEEIQVHRGKVENYVTEVAELKAEITMHREKVAFYMADSECNRKKLEECMEEISRLNAELQLMLGKLEFFMSEADLPSLPLWRLLEALPRNIARTLTKTKRGPIVGTSPGSF